MSGALRLLGGNSSLNTVVSDMNTNILRLQPIVKGNFTKVAKSGTTSGTAALSSTVTITVAHGLSYIPQAVVYAKAPSDTRYFPLPFTDFASGATVTINSFSEFGVTATNLLIYITLNSSSTLAGVWTFKYDILTSTAN